MANHLCSWVGCLGGDCPVHPPVDLFWKSWFCWLTAEGLFLFSRSVRFRWYQGFYPAGSQPVTWAIDNVYIGPQCEEMCSGHGGCINGTKCVCDPGYSGPACRVSTKNPDFLKDDFEGDLFSSVLGSSVKEVINTTENNQVLLYCLSIIIMIVHTREFL